MPTIDLTDEEHAALTAAARKVIDEDRYPLSPHLALAPTPGRASREQDRNIPAHTVKALHAITGR